MSCSFQFTFHFIQAYIVFIFCCILLYTYYSVIYIFFSRCPVCNIIIFLFQKKIGCTYVRTYAHRSKMSFSQPRSVFCPLCGFQSQSLPQSLSHLRLLHRNDPRFSVRCGVSGCSYTGKSFSALYTHIYRNHPGAGVIQKRNPNSRDQSSVVSETESVPGTSGTFSLDSQGKYIPMLA